MTNEEIVLMILKIGMGFGTIGAVLLFFDTIHRRFLDTIERQPVVEIAEHELAWCESGCHKRVYGAILCPELAEYIQVCEDCWTKCEKGE